MRKFQTSFLLTSLPDGSNCLITKINHLVGGRLPDGLPYPYHKHSQPDFKPLYLFVCLRFINFLHLVSTPVIFLKPF